MEKLIFIALFALFACNAVNPPSKGDAPDSSDIPLETLIMPDGYSISLYATDVPNARSMDYSPNGTLFVGTRGEGKVYALRDNDGDNKAEEMFVLDKNLRMPNGVAFRDGDLYVAEVSRVLRYRDIENNLASPPEPEVVFDGYPRDGHHGWKFISLGPDGKLYVPVGAPCNICESEDPVYNTITRLDLDNPEAGYEIVQSGVRNTVGFTWHPDTGEIWFTDNGRDWMGDDLPACELNRAATDGMHFGYPYCHQGDLADPEFGSKFPCSDFEPPVQNLGPHTAPLGLEFCFNEAFSSDLQGHLLIAEHGSWNRSKKIGYRVSLVRLDGNEATSYEDFISGWLNEETDEVWGRPVDLEWLPDGSLLLSDDFADAIYRITYSK